MLVMFLVLKIHKIMTNQMIWGIQEYSFWHSYSLTYYMGPWFECYLYLSLISPSFTPRKNQTKYKYMLRSMRLIWMRWCNLSVNSHFLSLSLFERIPSPTKKKEIANRVMDDWASKWQSEMKNLFSKMKIQNILYLL